VRTRTRKKSDLVDFVVQLHDLVEESNLVFYTVALVVIKIRVAPVAEIFNSINGGPLSLVQGILVLLPRRIVALPAIAGCAIARIGRKVVRVRREHIRSFLTEAADEATRSDVVRFALDDGDGLVDLIFVVELSLRIEREHEREQTNQENKELLHA
jgi:hypothetical protein